MCHVQWLSNKLPEAIEMAKLALHIGIYLQYGSSQFESICHLNLLISWSIHHNSTLPTTEFANLQHTLSNISIHHLNPYFPCQWKHIQIKNYSASKSQHVPSIDFKQNLPEGCPQNCFRRKKQNPKDPGPSGAKAEADYGAEQRAVGPFAGRDEFFGEGDGRVI